MVQFGLKGEAAIKDSRNEHKEGNVMNFLWKCQ